MSDASCLSALTRGLSSSAVRVAVFSWRRPSHRSWLDVPGVGCALLCLMASFGVFFVVSLTRLPDSIVQHLSAHLLLLLSAHIIQQFEQQQLLLLFPLTTGTL